MTDHTGFSDDIWNWCVCDVLKAKAMRIINSDISYEQALCQYQVPAVDQFIADLSRKTMLKIYSNTNHPLSCVIKNDPDAKMPY